MRAFLTLLLLLSASLAHAKDGGAGGGGGTGTHGGEGVVIGGKIHLKDFFEAGLVGTGRPYFNPEREYEPSVAAAVQNQVALNGPVAQLFAVKLLEIKRLSPLLGYLIERMLMRYDWTLSREPLLELTDGKSVVKSSTERPKIQLALREGARITIYARAFERMDEANQVGLIFHEMVYALDDAFTSGEVDSNITRRVTSSLFKESTTKKSPTDFALFINDSGLSAGKVLASSLLISPKEVQSYWQPDSVPSTVLYRYRDFTPPVIAFNFMNVLPHGQDSQSTRCLPSFLYETQKKIEHTVVRSHSMVSVEANVEIVLPGYAAGATTAVSLSGTCDRHFPGGKPASTQAEVNYEPLTVIGETRFMGK